jgi:hypothetical protein
MPGICLPEMRKSPTNKHGIEDGIQNGYLPNKDTPRLDHELRSGPFGATSNRARIHMARYVHRPIQYIRQHTAITQSTTLIYERPQHDHPVARVIAQHYPSAPLSQCTSIPHLGGI